MRVQTDIICTNNTPKEKQAEKRKEKWPKIIGAHVRYRVHQAKQKLLQGAFTFTFSLTPSLTLRFFLSSFVFSCHYFQSSSALVTLVAFTDNHLHVY